ncbi:cytochrome P450 [Nocardioides marmorisolisilvae]|uniref:Cytochrome n=1 Tax=Nocardioides marmorisolisilvae TaxID=1542737 RepID=A0A3N0DWZ8_9ACTN|nr:cytochrome P450 [Nocardioides marmorisolisilvae]RNL80144.1 cytochrome [Nocardioides marmorisolisilvae]
MRADITPSPPLAEGVGLPWDVPVDDAVAVLARARAAYGDTFVVETGRDRYLFTFSPTGVESFYALPEEKASKGVADYLMLRRKLPDEIFEGRRTLPGSLFRKGDVATYLDNLGEALDTTSSELGTSGTVDVFGLTRRLAHRMGLASWAGPGCASGDDFERLVAAFDTLDGSDAFVHPDAMAAVAASGKAAEKAALDEITAVVGASIDRPGASDLFARIVAAWDGDPDRERGIAWDVALIHVASMSNLAAALGWALVDLVEHPEQQAAIRAGDTELAHQCTLESTRLAQRSIMGRTVLEPVDLDVGGTTYRVGAGATIATLLPLTNTSAAPGLDEWRPERWNRSRLADPSALASVTLVTAFGHGKHTCPAQPFSVSAMSMAVTHLLGEYDVDALWPTYPVPVPAQIGGVARSDGDCVMRYRRRA